MTPARRNEVALLICLAFVALYMFGCAGLLMQPDDVAARYLLAMGLLGLVVAVVLATCRVG